MVKLVVSGCYGRMGQRITQLASQDKDFQIAALLENPNHPSVNESLQGIKIQSDTNAIKGSDVMIEFTSPEATIVNLQACVKNKVNIVIGTTGLIPEQIALIEKASQKIGVVFSSNMSVGVNILFGLAKEAAARTGQTYKVKIIEGHHIHKKDKPSGTAKTLAEYVVSGSGIPVTDIESIREGEIIGDHEVIFESPEDTIKIYHHAKTRDIFAKGALVAAKFLAKKQKGLFNMQDVLGMK